MAVGAHGRLLSGFRFNLVHIWEMTAAVMGVVKGEDIVLVRILHTVHGEPFETL
jgi:hypothetical protein